MFFPSRLSSSSCCFRMTLSIGPSHLSFSAAASLQFSLVALECCSLCNSVLASSSLETKCWYCPHQQVFHFMLLCVIPHAHEVRRIIQLRTFANLFLILCGLSLIVFGIFFLASSPRRFRVGQVAVSVSWSSVPGCISRGMGADAPLVSRLQLVADIL